MNAVGAAVHHGPAQHTILLETLDAVQVSPASTVSLCIRHAKQLRLLTQHKSSNMQLPVLISSQSGLFLFGLPLDQRHSIPIHDAFLNLFKPACPKTVKLTGYTCSAHAVKYVSSS